MKALFFTSSGNDDFRFEFEFTEYNNVFLKGKCYSGSIEKIEIGQLWLYESRIDGSRHEVLCDDSNVMFEYSFCWRGVWEGRLYFPDKEYWSEDLAEINEAWNFAEEEFKKLIRLIQPNISEQS